jgi:hypothetical protein
MNSWSSQFIVRRSLRFPYRPQTESCVFCAVIVINRCGAGARAHVRHRSPAFKVLRFRFRRSSLSGALSTSTTRNPFFHQTLGTRQLGQVRIFLLSPSQQSGVVEVRRAPRPYAEHSCSRRLSAGAHNIHRRRPLSCCSHPYSSRPSTCWHLQDTLLYPARGFERRRPCFHHRITELAIESCA